MNKGEDNLKDLIEFHIKRLEGRAGTLSIDEIIERLNIKAVTRKSGVVAKRRFFWYYLRRINTQKFTLEKLGELTGGHDHATVRFGLEALKNPHYLRSQKKASLEVLELFKDLKI